MSNPPTDHLQEMTALLSGLRHFNPQMVAGSGIIFYRLKFNVNAAGLLNQGEPGTPRPALFWRRRRREIALQK
jgi:hypothetical protein